MRNSKNKMQIVGGTVSKTVSDDADLFFWAEKTWQERLIETERLRKLIWTHLLGYYPNKMDLVGKIVNKEEKKMKQMQRL